MDDDLGRMTREELIAHLKSLRGGIRAHRDSDRHEVQAPRAARTWQAFEDRARVARVWQGRTREALAETYARYLYAEGIKKLRATRGNLGVQVFREVRDGVAHFTTISYWASRELPRHVRHFDILVNEWGN